MRTKKNVNELTCFIFKVWFNVFKLKNDKTDKKKQFVHFSHPSTQEAAASCNYQSVLCIYSVSMSLVYFCFVF